MSSSRVIHSILLMCVLLVKPAMAQTSSRSGCQEITVMGAVNMAGRFQFEERLRLLEILAIAGGPSGSAGKTVRVIHTCTEREDKSPDVGEYDLSSVLSGKDSATPYLTAGDLVVVPETEMVFVIGNVSRSKSFIFREGLTLTRVLAAAGVVQSSDLVRVKIHHPRTATQRYDFTIINLKSIYEGRIQDPVLRPWDILEVSDEDGRFVLDDPSRLSPPGFRDAPLFPRKSPNC